MTKQVALRGTAPPSIRSTKSVVSRLWFVSLLLCALVYLFCALAMAAPLYHTARALPMQTSLSQVILTIGTYLHLPIDLHLAQDIHASQQMTGFNEILLLLFCMFVAYILCAICIQKQKASIVRKYSIFFVIAITTLVAAYIYVFTPATLSEDIYLYADYGRILVAHSANPYFTPPSGFPQDPLFQFVYWKNVVAIYGPVWMLVCAGLTSFTGTNTTNIFLAFRIFACTIHILNILLIFAILRAKGCSTRTVLLGTQLYAWNPLVLFESSTGGHNDILMVTFVLLGILWAVRAEKRHGFVHFIPPLLAFTLAVLVKFTIIPILVLFIIMLLFKTYLSSTRSALTVKYRLRSALVTGVIACSICLSIAFLFYGPFWLGHSLKAILAIFSSQPPAIFAFTSLLSGLQIWNNFHPLPAILAPLLSLHMWNLIIYGGMLLVLLLGSIRLYHIPTIQNVVVLTLGVMAVFLLTTNWFLPWYITGALSLAVICLPVTEIGNQGTGRIGQALIAFAFTFSFSAFLTYYYNFVGSYSMRTHPPHIGGLLLAYLVAFILPVLAFLIFLWRRPPQIIQSIP